MQPTGLWNNITFSTIRFLKQFSLLMATTNVTRTCNHDSTLMSEMIGSMHRVG